MIGKIKIPIIGIPKIPFSFSLKILAYFNFFLSSCDILDSFSFQILSFYTNNLNIIILSIVLVRKIKIYPTKDQISFQLLHNLVEISYIKKEENYKYRSLKKWRALCPIIFDFSRSVHRATHVRAFKLADYKSGGHGEKPYRARD